MDAGLAGRRQRRSWWLWPELDVGEVAGDRSSVGGKARWIRRIPHHGSMSFLATEVRPYARVAERSARHHLQAIPPADHGATVSASRLRRTRVHQRGRAHRLLTSSLLPRPISNGGSRDGDG